MRATVLLLRLPPLALVVAVASGLAVTAAPPASAAAPTVPVACAPAPATGIDLGGPRLAQAGVQSALPAGRPAPPPISATAWLVADLSSGQVVAACNAHLRLRPASTLKVLTALSLVESLDPGTLYTATAQDASVDGSKVGLVPGSTYSVVDLLHGMLLPSGNDAANAFAALAGGMPAATSRMNAEARRLQANETVAVNTSGLDADGQVSSAYDLALLGREALKRPWLAAVMTTPRYSFPGANPPPGASRTHYQIQNGNRLLGTFQGATGVKNGFTSLAAGTFIGSATRGSRSYLVTVMNAGHPVTPMAAELLTWAFASGPGAMPVGRLVEPLSAGGQGAPPTSAGPPSPSSSGQPSTTPAIGQGASSTPGVAAVQTPEASPAVTVTAVAAEPLGSEQVASTQAPRLAALGYIALAGLLAMSALGLRGRRLKRARRRVSTRK